MHNTQWALQSDNLEVSSGWLLKESDKYISSFLGGTGELSGAVGENRNRASWPSLSENTSVGLSAVWCCSVCHVWLFCSPIDSSSPGSSVHGILQASVLERVALPSFRGSSRPRNQTHIFCTGRQILYHWATREAQASRWVPNLKPSPQAKAPRGATGLFHRKTGGVFQPVVCAVPWGGSRPTTVSPIVTNLWHPRTQASLGFRARRSKGDPWAAATRPRVPDAGENPLWSILYSGMWQRENLERVPLAGLRWGECTDAPTCGTSKAGVN